MQTVTTISKCSFLTADPATQTLAATRVASACIDRHTVTIVSILDMGTRIRLNTYIEMIIRIRHVEFRVSRSMCKIDEVRTQACSPIPTKALEAAQVHGMQPLWEPVQRWTEDELSTRHESSPGSLSGWYIMIDNLDVASQPLESLRYRDPRGWFYAPGISHKTNT